ncbi:MAG TPA: DNA mismatch repair endonuclease MutL [Firmicutes bacterium]|nr:DNA mismatch repair endonuclease MutL [Bacillota bacterium]
MSRINLMSAELANRIAAGEVVDRPSSVVKELVENSLDAKSKNIRISINQAGRDMIRVQDDGIGMDAIDAELCFLRHASSKIKSTFDLRRITTLGFRGEALPSIASVSNVTMLTYDGNSSTGYEVYVEPGKDPIVKEGLKRQGTIFTIRDLFFNTPARLKYLKSDNTENSSIIEVCENLAISNSGVAFELEIDGKRIFKTSGRGNLKETISEIYGLDIVRSTIEFNGENQFFKVSGYVCKPNISYASRYHILTFLNGRSVYIYKVNQALLTAFKDYLPPNRYPFAVISIEADYALVDVNVHPSKKEVRISEEEKLSKLVEESVKSALISDRPIYTPVKINVAGLEKLDKVKEQLTLSDVVNDEDNNIYQESIKEEENIIKDEVKEEVNNEVLPVIKEEENEKPVDLLESEPRTFLPDLEVIGQVLKTYIVCDGSDGIYLIDQHAAQERINYEKVLADFSKKEMEVVSPLSPILIDVSPSVMIGLDEKHIAQLHRIGFDVEVFTGNTLRVSTIPLLLKDDDDTSMIKDLICSCLQDKKCEMSDLKHLAIATVACKASIKANMFLTKEMMETLIKQLAQCKNPNNCPHGRPTIIKLSKYEIEKLFKRTGF